MPAYRQRNTITLNRTIRLTCLLGGVLIPLLSIGKTGATSFYEEEPNNVPAEANRISGAVTLLGTMPGQDQDGYLWTVSDDDARKRWTFELQGIPGALTITEVVRIDYAQNGVEVARADRLMKMGTRDGLSPSVAADLLLEPGDYLLGIAHAGGGSNSGTQGGIFRPPSAKLSFGESGTPENEIDPDGIVAVEEDPGGYRFHIREGKQLFVQSSATAKAGSHGSRETARVVRPGRTHAAFDHSRIVWYSITFSEADAGMHWDINMRVPVGRSAKATLYGDGEEPLTSASADKSGTFAFPDLAPDAGTYYVKLEAELNSPGDGFIRVLETESAGERVNGSEAEPNGKWALANRISLDTPLTGRFGEQGETDFFRFEPPATGMDQLQVLRVETIPPESRLEVCLLAADGKRVQCRRDDAPIELPDLLLGEDPWGLSLSRGGADVAYEISLKPQGAISPDREVEPNDSIEFASSMPPKSRIRGRFSGDELDVYRFVVTSEPQLWRLQVMGDGLSEITYQDRSGRTKNSVRPKGGERRIRLENLYLLPGEHFLKIQGKAGTDYTVLARKLGQPDPNMEREPNDDTSRMHRLAMGQTRTGVLPTGNDQDLYRFFLGNRDHIQLTLTPPPDGVVEPNLYWYGQSLGIAYPRGPGEPVTLSGVFPPGDYYLVLKPNTVSDAEYKLSLERLPRYACATDCEPSGMKALYSASRLPAHGVLEGRSGDWRDVDAYELPSFNAPTGLLIRSAQPVRLSLTESRAGTEQLKYDKATGTYQATVPAGGPYRLIVDSRNEPYRLELEFNGKAAPAAPAPLAAELDLSFEQHKVSAYRSNGQRLSGELKLLNSGTTPIDVAVEATTSDYRWQIAIGDKKIALAPGASKSVAMVLDVPPDAWADRSVRISARAVDTRGAQIETWQEIEVARDIPAVNPTLGWTIPTPLRGGFNLLAAPHGAEWAADQAKVVRPELLRDGLVFSGLRAECCKGDFPPALTLSLPGDEPVPVAGVAINQFGSPGAFKDLRKATLLLSDDGVTYREAFSFEALPLETEQYFALPEPVPARFARLRLETNFRYKNGNNPFVLSEWKVIATPGYDLSHGQGFNLADPALGGHVVSDSPPKPYPPRTVINESVETYRPRVKPGENLSYVIGFNNNRAAKITRIEWQNSENIDDRYRVNRVLAATSIESSIGPWEPLGELDPNIKPMGVLNLDTPVWARFVRLTAITGDQQAIVESPTHIRIWEQPTGPDYQSVLSEWGYASTRSFYELEQGLQPEPSLEPADNDSRETAAALAVDQLAAGQVELARHEHWYRLQMPASDNTLTVNLTGDPTVRTEVKLETAAGEPVLLRKNDRASTPALHIFEAAVKPGSELFFHVAEPPRNVIFTWDTSPSVNYYLPTIYASLSAFAGQVIPGQESVNLMPFAHQRLLENWQGEPYVLQTILNDLARTKSSSSAEHALQKATQLLAPRAGTKAIVMITDGDTVHHGPVWRDLAEVQPRIFSIGVAGTAGSHVDVMEDWAAVNGGHYKHLNYEGEMEVAFDRATTLMRRPAEYSLLVSSEYREAPGPGTLIVSAIEGTAAEDGAVELILDASGSMLQRLDGKRRIHIAKEVLTEAVTSVIPAGTPVALRVFGHKEPDACRTDLEIALKPLDPDEAAAAIAGIQAMNLARTPIADSLAAVKNDLKGVDGRVAIVLVTDGEETCDGAPEKVIESLQAAGISVTLNIVGFAIDDDVLESQFRSWADAGNGRYFSANDQAGLSDSIAEALQTTYAVYDGAGTRVASGLVSGEPVELDQGIYRVVVQDAKGTVFDNVEVMGEQRSVLKL